MDPSHWRRFRYRLAVRVAGTRDPRSAQSKRSGIDVQLFGECVAKLMDVMSCHKVMRHILGRGSADGGYLFR